MEPKPWPTLDETLYWKKGFGSLSWDLFDYIDAARPFLNAVRLQRYNEDPTKCGCGGFDEHFEDCIGLWAKRLLEGAP